MINAERRFLPILRKPYVHETTIFVSGSIKTMQSKASIDGHIHSLKEDFHAQNVRPSDYYERIKPLRRMARALNGSHIVKQK